MKKIIPLLLIFFFLFSCFGREQSLNDHKRVSQSTIKSPNTTNVTLRTRQGHIDGVTASIFLPNQKQVLSSGRDGMIFLWDIETGFVIKSFNNGSPIKTLILTPNADKVIIGGENTRIFDLKTWQITQSWSNGAMGLAISHDGTFLAARSSGAVTLYNLKNTPEQDKIYGYWDIKSDGYDTGNSGIAFSHDGHLLALGYDTDNSVRIIDATSKETLQRIPILSEVRGIHLAFSPDGKNWLSHSNIQKIRQQLKLIYLI